MPDYIYLLENRLSADQQNALRQVAGAAREAGMNVFLVGGAVRDLTSGSSVRDLDIAVQGNALKLQKPLEKRGAKLWGEHPASRTLFFRFPVSVRVEVSSTRREEYPKPDKPVYFWDNILEDLRRRDFTANAMAISLNERSYGLLMDPRNGVADIEARSLQLVSNYGFLEEPARLLRATRLAARLGWELEERTKARYQSAKDEGVIKFLSSYQRGYELEEIGHEEDGLRVLEAMEREGWMEHLAPAWTHSQADAAGLEEMHRVLTQLQMQGINPDTSAISMQLLTAKLSPRELSALKNAFVRPGFVAEWNQLDQAAKELQKQLMGKGAQTPSTIWKLFTSADPQAVLWLRLTSKSAPILAKYESFFKVWPEARQKIPNALMQELRITPEIPAYQEMLDRLFFETMDGKLETEEQIRRFLEPYSPPAPPPPVTVRRSRTSRKASPAKGKSPAEAAEDGSVDGASEKETGEEREIPAKPAVAQKKAKAKVELSAQKPALASPSSSPARRDSKERPKASPKPSSKSSPKADSPAAKKKPAPPAKQPAKAKPARAASASKPARAAGPRTAVAKKPTKAPGAKAASRLAGTAGKSAAKSRPLQPIKSGKPALAAKTKKKPIVAKKIK